MSSFSRDEKLRRQQTQQVAYELQHKGAVEGAIRWTFYGIVACTLGHHFSPFFRRQTLGLKAFLTSSATIYGLVVGADYHLLGYEHSVRKGENDMRREARNALAREGKIATEGEIRKWRLRRDADLAAGGDGTGSASRTAQQPGIGELAYPGKQLASQNGQSVNADGSAGTGTIGKVQAELAAAPLHAVKAGGTPTGLEGLATGGLMEEITSAENGDSPTPGTAPAEGETGALEGAVDHGRAEASGKSEAVLSGASEDLSAQQNP